MAQEGLAACQDSIATKILADDLKAAVASKTKQGFIIMLSRPAPVDLTFSWQATAVKDVKTSVSKSTEELLDEVGDVAGSSTPSATLSPTVTPTITPTPVQEEEPTPTPSGGASP